MWYILDENNIPVVANISAYVDWEEAYPEKRCLRQQHIGNIFISTVFLGLDHAHGSKTPLLWETMIFEGEHDQYQERYSNYEAALRGHDEAIKLVIGNSIKRYIMYQISCIISKIKSIL